MLLCTDVDNRLFFFILDQMINFQLSKYLQLIFGETGQKFILSENSQKQSLRLVVLIHP